jgi:hypothetical protein
MSYDIYLARRSPVGVTGASAARFALLVAEVGEPPLPLVSASADDVQACILAVGGAFFLVAHASCLFGRLFAGASRVLRIERRRSRLDLALEDVPEDAMRAK